MAHSLSEMTHSVVSLNERLMWIHSWSETTVIHITHSLRETTYITHSLSETTDSWLIHIIWDMTHNWFILYETWHSISYEAHSSFMSLTSCVTSCEGHGAFIWHIHMSYACAVSLIRCNIYVTFICVTSWYVMWGTQLLIWCIHMSDTTQSR